MGFFTQQQSNRRKVFLNLAGSVDGQLRDAYAKRYAAGLDNQVSLSKKLGVGRSVVNRRLMGRTNMEIETLADMVWALGYCIKVEIFNPYEKPSNEARIISEHAAPTDGVVIGSTSITVGRLEYAK